MVIKKQHLEFEILEIEPRKESHDAFFSRLPEYFKSDPDDRFCHKLYTFPMN